MRVSATDWVDGGWIEETVALARELKALGCDFMDVSTGGLDGRQKIPLSAGYQVPFGEQVRKATGIKTMSVGLIANARQAEDIIASGKAISSCWGVASCTIRVGLGTPPKSLAPRPPMRRR